MILVALVGLSLFAFIVRHKYPGGAGSLVAAKNDAGATAKSGKDILVNGGFEEGFPPYVGVKPSDVVNISGDIAKGWGDNSGWAKIDVRYDKDTQNPHSGSFSQRIAIGKIRWGQNLFAQRITVPIGTTLSGTVWVRSDKPLQPGDVQLGLREMLGHYTLIASTPVAATPEWQSFTVRGTTATPDAMVLMLTTQRADVTLWVDDASLKATP